MYKKGSCILLCVFLASGCASATEEEVKETSGAVAESTSESTNFSGYKVSVASENNFTSSLKRTDEIIYEDGSTTVSQMDGLFVSDGKNAHFTQNISADGMETTMEGWLLDGVLYASYNGITYYENTDLTTLKKDMLVPLNMHEIDEGDVSKMTVDENTYTFSLKNSYARTLFESEYDGYGYSSYDYSIDSATLIQETNEEGKVIREEAAFTLKVTVEDMELSVSVMTQNEQSYIGESSITVSDSQKEEFDTYVYYEDIDTDAISDEDITADTEESTVEATLKKRLVNRLGYTADGDTYSVEFNENESYSFDFSNHIFTYSNYTSSYVYNWYGDNGGFGSTCSYDFSNDTYTTDCDESVVEMIQEVKKFYIMELYYCGVSPDDLLEEERQ